MENLSKAISQFFWHKKENTQTIEEHKQIEYLQNELARYIAVMCPYIDTDYFLNNHK